MDHVLQNTWPLAAGWDIGDGVGQDGNSEQKIEKWFKNKKLTYSEPGSHAVEVHVPEGGLSSGRF